MKNSDQQSLVGYLAPNIGASIGGGLMLWILFALFNMPVMVLLFGWLTGTLLFIACRAYRFYRT
jgi:hypothetical protein